MCVDAIGFSVVVLAGWKIGPGESPGVIGGLVAKNCWLAALRAWLIACKYSVASLFPMNTRRETSLSLQSDPIDHLRPDTCLTVFLAAEHNAIPRLTHL